MQFVQKIIILNGGQKLITKLKPIHQYQVEIGKEVVVAVDSRYFRSTEVDLLLGDPTKAEQKLRLEQGI